MKINRAIATLNRLKAEEERQKKQLRTKADRSKPFDLKNATEIRFRVSTKTRSKLQQNADKFTHGNLSEYMRQIANEELESK